MKINRKYLIKAIGWIILAGIMALKLPHINKSVAQIMIPPIKTSENSRLYLSGMLILIPIFLSYIEIVKSNVIKNRVIIWIIILLIVPPIFNMLNILKEPYYYFTKGIKSLEVTDSHYSFGFFNDVDKKIDIEIDIKNYSNKPIGFNVALILPEELLELDIPQRIIMPNKYFIGPRGNLSIQENCDISYVERLTFDSLSDIHYYSEDFHIEIFTNEDSILISQSK